MSLIGHIQASMKLVESAIASEALADNGEIAANVVVLDDITPRYVRANAALTACNAGLGAALQVLLDAGPSRHGAEGADACELRRGPREAVVRTGVVPPHCRP
jgi:hypothetical protein